MLIAATGPGPRASGASLIEVMVAITIAVISLAMAAPTFANWLRNSRIRTAAESLQNGLRFAQTEALRRNAPVRFQLMSSTGASCATAYNASFWIVNLGLAVSPSGACASPISDSVSPFVLMLGPTENDASAVTIAASRSVIAFDGLGRQIATTNPTTPVQPFKVSLNSATSTCVAAGGPTRCLDVRVSTSGQIKLCDPGLSSATSATAGLAC